MTKQIGGNAIAVLFGSVCLLTAVSCGLLLKKLTPKADHHIQPSG